MRILFATTNKAKIKKYADVLKDEGFDILTLEDLDIDLDVEESGKFPLENAILKAKTYYGATNIITIAEDDGLFIEGISIDKQPGNEVRRVNGKRLSDTEMIDYYTDLIEKIGGKAKARWIRGLAIYDGINIYTHEKESERVFVSSPSKVLNEGYPLDSITYFEEYGMYRSELSNEQINDLSKNDDGIVSFIKDTLFKLDRE